MQLARFHPAPIGTAASQKQCYLACSMEMARCLAPYETDRVCSDPPLQISMCLKCGLATLPWGTGLLPHHFLGCCAQCSGHLLRCCLTAMLPSATPATLCMLTCGHQCWQAGSLTITTHRRQLGIDAEETSLQQQLPASVGLIYSRAPSSKPTASAIAKAVGCHSFFYAEELAAIA